MKIMPKVEPGIPDTPGGEVYWISNLAESRSRDVLTWVPEDAPDDPYRTDVIVEMDREQAECLYARLGVLLYQKPDNR